MNDYNYQNHNKNQNKYNKHDKKEKENNFLDALVYFIMLITMIMISPLIYKFANDYSDSRISVSGTKKEIVSERSVKNRKYTVAENAVDLSVLRNTEFGRLGLITAKVTDNGDVILFCTSQILKVTGEEGSDVDVKEEYEDALRIAFIKKNTENIYIINDEIIFGAYSDNNIFISRRTVSNRYNFLDSVQNKNFVFKDYSDGTFFLSNNKNAFLFDTEKMRIEKNYAYPAHYHVYQAALSNNKEMIALATEEGFFVGNLSVYDMGLNSSNMKELIATGKVNGVKKTVRYPSWSADDQLIYYKLYDDDTVKNAGVTTTLPGGNEQLTSLNSKNFIFMNNDSVFYYFLPNSETTQDNIFRRGYFNINDKKMTDIMKSQVNYFDINVSSNGNHLAALSRNGNMIKISIIDIRTKKLIYSSLYSDIYDFSFSPDEKNVMIYGRADGRRTLKIISIYWTEE